MDITAFFLLSLALIALPGPNVLLITSTSLLHGTVRGLQTVAGTSAAMAVQLVAAALGTASLIALASEALDWLRWIGAAYLLVLGLMTIGSLGRRDRAWTPDPARSFTRGFWTSLANPKTLLFFTAYLPQFVSGDDPYLAQLALLSLLFWSTAIVVDSCYAILAAQLTTLVQRDGTRRMQRKLSGVLYIGAGLALALLNRRG